MKVVYIEDNETLGELFCMMLADRLPNLKVQHSRNWGSITDVCAGDLIFADLGGVGKVVDVPCKVFTVSGDCFKSPDVMKPYSDTLIVRMVREFLRSGS